MKEKVLFVVLEQYADWEYSHLAVALQGAIQDKTSPYEVVTVSLGRNPVKSIGGFATIPDCTIGESWLTTRESSSLAASLGERMGPNR